jgi:hypothetical protein
MRLEKIPSMLPTLNLYSTQINSNIYCKKMFEPFLSLHSQNRLEVKNNDFYRDCRMKWILNKTDLKYNIKATLCTTHKVYIYRLAINDLNKCIWKRAITMILFPILQMISISFLKNYVLKLRLYIFLYFSISNLLADECLTS